MNGDVPGIFLKKKFGVRREALYEAELNETS